MARSPAFDQAVPAYLLDENYYFLDWNVAFDEVVAKPLGFRRRYSHAEDFLNRLHNAQEVYERARRVFDPQHHDRVPLIDIERLLLETEPFGLIEFQKMAVQIMNDEAQVEAWSVCLNICVAENLKLLWERLSERLEEELNWSRYAISYDRLLRNFDDYGQLIDNAVGRLKGCRSCLDLGAGTGNGTLALLRAQPDRKVWAVELNHSMLERLIRNVEQAEKADRTRYFSRLRPIKEDICRLTDLPRQRFDGAMLTNVLYAVDQPAACLQQVYDLLSPGGRVVISTPHKQTNIDKLFVRMQTVLRQKNLFRELEPYFLDARERHRGLTSLIHRDSKEEIRRWFQNAGFEIVDWQDAAYADSVVVVEARKPN